MHLQVLFLILEKGFNREIHDFKYIFRERRFELGFYDCVGVFLGRGGGRQPRAARIVAQG